MGLRAAIMLGALLVGLPVHAGRALVEHLHAVHAAVALAGVGIAREDHGQRDKAAAVFGPTLEHGEIEQRKTAGADHFLAGAFGDRLGEECAHLDQLGQHFELAHHPLRHAHFEELDDARGHLLHRGHFQRDLHFAHGGERIDQHRRGVAFGLFEQQRGAAPLDGAVGEFGDLQDGIDLKRDALQLAILFQSADEVAQISIGHTMSMVSMHRLTPPRPAAG